MANAKLMREALIQLLGAKKATKNIPEPRGGDIEQLGMSDPVIDPIRPNRPPSNDLDTFPDQGTFYGNPPDTGIPQQSVNINDRINALADAIRRSGIDNPDTASIQELERLQPGAGREIMQELHNDTYNPLGERIK